MSWFRQLCFRILPLLLVLSPCWAQLRNRGVSSEKGADPEIGERPSAVLKVEKKKGAVKAVDLEKRTVTVTISGSEKVFNFPTSSGREKISLSKKVAQTLGKKALHLEEIPIGSEVVIQYYPSLGSIMDITVEGLPK